MLEVTAYVEETRNQKSVRDKTEQVTILLRVSLWFESILLGHSNYLDTT